MGSTALSRINDEVTCYIFIRWDGEGSKRNISYTNADVGGSGIDFSAAP